MQLNIYNLHNIWI